MKFETLTADDRDGYEIYTEEEIPTSTMVERLRALLLSVSDIYPDWDVGMCKDQLEFNLYKENVTCNLTKQEYYFYKYSKDNNRGLDQELTVPFDDPDVKLKFRQFLTQ